MKGKSILFKIAGILQFVCCGIIAFFSGLILLIRPLVNKIIEGSYDELLVEIEKLGAEGDESIQAILNLSKEEISAYFLKITLIFALIMLAIAIIGIVFGVLFIKLSKKYDYMLNGKLSKKIWLTVLTPIFCGITIPTILVVIAIWLPERKSEFSKELNN